MLTTSTTRSALKREGEGKQPKTRPKNTPKTPPRIPATTSTKTMVLLHVLSLFRDPFPLFCELCIRTYTCIHSWRERKRERGRKRERENPQGRPGQAQMGPGYELKPVALEIPTEVCRINEDSTSLLLYPPPKMDVHGYMYGWQDPPDYTMYLRYTYEDVHVRVQKISAYM